MGENVLDQFSERVSSVTTYLASFEHIAFDQSTPQMADTVIREIWLALDSACELGYRITTGEVTADENIADQIDSELATVYLLLSDLKQCLPEQEDSYRNIVLSLRDGAQRLGDLVGKINRV